MQTYGFVHCSYSRRRRRAVLNVIILLYLTGACLIFVTVYL